MKITRANFGLLVLGSPLLVACGSGAQESTDEAFLGLTVTTSYMEIWRVRFFLAGVITFSIVSPAEPLYLAAFSIQRVSSITGVTGVIAEGTPSDPGRANLQVGVAKYDSIAVVLNSKGPHYCAVTFDSLTLVPSNLFLR